MVCGVALEILLFVLAIRGSESKADDSSSKVCSEITSKSESLSACEENILPELLNSSSGYTKFQAALSKKRLADSNLESLTQSSMLSSKEVELPDESTANTKSDEKCVVTNKKIDHGEESVCDKVVDDVLETSEHEDELIAFGAEPSAPEEELTAPNN